MWVRKLLLIYLKYSDVHFSPVQMHSKARALEA